MLNFILPVEQNRDDVLSFYDEIEKYDGECIGIGNYKNYDLWLEVTVKRFWIHL